MEEKPFWEKTYADKDVNTFQKGPTKDVEEFYPLFKPKSITLDVGCGEGRNPIFLAQNGNIVDAFDISEKGIEKAIFLADKANVSVNFFTGDLRTYQINKDYDLILSHGVMPLPRRTMPRLQKVFLMSASCPENIRTGKSFIIIKVHLKRVIPEGSIIYMLLNG